MSALLTPDEARARLLAAVEEAGGPAAFATRNGLTRQYVFQVVHEIRPMSDRLARALGLERVESYRLTGPAADGKVPTVRTPAPRRARGAQR